MKRLLLFAFICSLAVTMQAQVKVYGFKKDTFLTNSDRLVLPKGRCGTSSTGCKAQRSEGTILIDCRFWY